MVESKHTTLDFDTIKCLLEKMFLTTDELGIKRGSVWSGPGLMFFNPGVLRDCDK
jgi:hypothetical protein